jgi:hypothetical protein
MRQNGTRGGATGTPTQVQPTLENWYGVQVVRRRRLKVGIKGMRGKYII